MLQYYEEGDGRERFFFGVIQGREKDEDTGENKWNRQSLP